MTMRQMLATTACAITITLLATSSAMAGTKDGQPCHKCDYRTAPPSSNPHDQMPKIVKVPCAPEQMGDCLKSAK